MAGREGGRDSTEVSSHRKVNHMTRKREGRKRGRKGGREGEREGGRERYLGQVVGEDVLKLGQGVLLNDQVAD